MFQMMEHSHFAYLCEIRVILQNLSMSRKKKREFFILISIQPGKKKRLEPP